MTYFDFDPGNTLAGRLSALSPRDAIRMAIALCEATERSVGTDGCHGAIWPGNISVSEDAAALGPIFSGSITELSPDALEFIAPEQFWNGSVGPASDVYSIGLILYTALNGGVMPFFDAAGEHSPEDRAFALQNRMKGAVLPAPATAGRELAAVVAKATAFQAEERYEKPAALKLALEALPEGAAVPAAAPFLPLTETEVKNAHSYKVDKNFEEIEPEKPKKPLRRKKEIDGVDENMDAEEFRANPKRKTAWILPAVLVLLIVVALALLLRGCRDYGDPNFPISTDAPEQSAEPVGQIHPPVSDPTPLPPVTEPVETPEPSETPVETPEPTPVVTYELCMDNCTWEEAKAKCEAKGGHLATVRSQAQLNEIIALASANGARYVWLGAYRASNGHWYYVTGEALDFTVWDTNEPSAMDQDGTREDYLLMWYRKNLDAWLYNDMRNDPVSVAPAYNGKLAYVCQYDSE